MKKLLKTITLMTVLLTLLISAALAQASGTVYSYSDLFTGRDLEQSPDLAKAVSYTLTDGEDIRITAAGVYVLNGTAKNATVYVEAGQDDKVQLVLNGVTVTNSDFPVIYVKSADKVFVTTGADSSLKVTGAFRTDGSVNTDGVIFSRSDLVLNGTAALSIVSTDNGVVSKDDLKVTGGTYTINAPSKAIDANDSIRIADGVFDLTAGTDGLHAENNDDDALGYIYIGGGQFNINAGDDAIHANSVVQIDQGTLVLRAAECIEGTYIQINDGSVDIQSWDDGLNAARKSAAYSAALEINGGEITVAMSQGDTDGIDSNGDLIINGGVIRVTASSSFDYDGSAQYNGGTIIVNGQQVSSIPNQMMGGRGMGGWGNQGSGSGWGMGGWGNTGRGGHGRGW